MKDPKERFPALPLRRRLLIALLAVVTAITVVLTLLDPPGGVKRHRPPPPADVERCRDGQTTGCVGGTAAVIVAAPAASR